MGEILVNKLTSRKFWLSAAAGLAAFGGGIMGLVIGEYDLTSTGLLCMAISYGIYTAAEAYVDGKREASNTTSVNKNVSASANNIDIVKDVITN